NHDHAFHHNEVSLGDGLEDEAPEPRQIEDVLDDDRTGQQEGKLQADDGQHRDQGIAQRMAPEGLPTAEALGAGGAHEVLAEHIEQRRSHDAREDRSLGQCERDGRQCQRLHGGQEAGAPARETAGRKPAQRDRKEQHQEHGEPEIRHGDAKLRHAHDGNVGR
ncbi:hypothetical protein COL154_014369, partial [Colletotrichum chrysophilum]